MEKEGVTIDFLWDPFLNSSRLNTELGLFHKPGTVGGDAEQGKSAAVLLAGAGLWYAKHIDPHPAAQWKLAIDNVLTHMRAAETSSLKPRSNLLLLAPVAVPVWEKLNEVNRNTILPEEVETMNKYLEKLSDTRGTDVFWAFNKFTATHPQLVDETGIHTIESIAGMKADALLNLRCNSELAAEYPYDGTCCNTYAAPNYIQWFVLANVLVIVPILLYMLSGCAPLPEFRVIFQKTTF